MEEKEISKYLKIIEELQKKKYGNSKDLENIKQKLIKDKDLEEAYVNYLTRSYSEIYIKQMRERIITTTTDDIQSKTIGEYIEVVSGQAVFETSVLSDVFGCISEKFESYFIEARENALCGMIDKAIKKGADAIVAIRFNDVSMEIKNSQLVLVVVHGTAVKFS